MSDQDTTYDHTEPPKPVGFSLPDLGEMDPGEVQAFLDEAIEMAQKIVVTEDNKFIIGGFAARLLQEAKPYAGEAN